MLKDKIFFTEGRKSRFGDDIVTKILSSLESKFTISEYKHLASGGTASVYEINDKVMRIGRWYNYPSEAELVYTKIKHSKPKYLVKVYYFDVLEFANKYYEISVLEKLTPLDESPALIKYNIPSIKNKMELNRHPMVVFFNLVGSLLFDGLPITVNNVLESRKTHMSWNSNIYSILKEKYIVEYLNDKSVQKIIDDIQIGFQQINRIDKQGGGDISFDNIMYDPKQNIYKLIDFV